MHGGCVSSLGPKGPCRRHYKISALGSSDHTSHYFCWRWEEEMTLMFKSIPKRQCGCRLLTRRCPAIMAIHGTGCCLTPNCSPNGSRVFVLSFARSPSNPTTKTFQAQCCCHAQNKLLIINAYFQTKKKAVKRIPYRCSFFFKDTKWCNLQN